MSTTKFQNVSTPRFYVDLLQYYKIIGHKHKAGETALYIDGFSGDFDEGLDTQPTILEKYTAQANSSPLGTMDPYTKRNSFFSEDGCGWMKRFFRFSDAYLDGEDWQGNVPWLLPCNNAGNYINYCAILGHNISGIYGETGNSIGVAPYATSIQGLHAGLPNPVDSYFMGDDNSIKNVIGTELWDGGPVWIQNNFEDSAVGFKAGGGFSIWEMNSGLDTSSLTSGNDYIPYIHEVGLAFCADGSNTFNPADLNMNSVLIGNYYDMPVSPNMQLSFERIYDGVDTAKTRGGGNLTNIRYTGPPSWGGFSQNFTKFHKDSVPNSNISRSGRRKWKLKFDMLSDDDIMGGFEAIGLSPYPDFNYENSAEHYEEEFTIPQDEGGDINNYYNPLLEENNFFSRVLVPTIGGRIPFMFNPRGGGNSPDNSPDQFAICTIDNKNLSFKQVNHRLYQVSLDIVETW